MRLFKRAPREFEVVIADPWTINGKPTEATGPREVLAEIYDAAIYFPITITVIGHEDSSVLEMDEHGNTRTVDSVSEISEEEDSSGAAAEEGAEEEGIALEELAEEPDAQEPTASSDLDEQRDQKRGAFIPAALMGKKALISAGGVLAAFALIVVAIAQFAGIGGSSDDAQASPGEQSWQTTLPTNADAGQSLDADFSDQLWTIEPGETDQVSWFRAGVITLDGDEIQLRSHLTGDEIATHTLDDVDLDDELRWATEFYHQEEPVVGMRFAETFVALTAEGQTQEWEVPSGMEVGVYGTTPTLTNAANAEGDDVTWQALRVGDEDPVDLTVNPAMATRAVDDEWIIQLEGGSPRVAMNPVDRDNEEMTPHAVNLAAPLEAAEFVRHLDAGHGQSLALWDVSGDLYLGVHPLEGDSAGEAATFVPAPFTEEEATGWAIARGMDLTIIGPYAVSLDTGELAAYSDAGDFTRGYGPAAVTADESDRRSFIVDNTAYTETDHIIGYTGRGTILVRLTDGSIAAYGENEGQA